MSEVRHSLTVRLVDRGSDGSEEDRVYTVSGIGRPVLAGSVSSEIAMSLMEACHALGIEPVELAADLLRWCEVEYIPSTERDFLSVERAALFRLAKTYLQARKQALSKCAADADAAASKSSPLPHPFTLRR